MSNRKKASDVAKTIATINTATKPAPSVEAAWEKIQAKRRRAQDPKTAKAAFLDAIREKVMYWQDQHDAGRVETHEAIEGVAHSILAMLSGVCLDNAGYAVCPLDDEREEVTAKDVAYEGDLHMLLVPSKLKKRGRK